MSDTKPDLDAIEARADHAGEDSYGDAAKAIYEDIPALVAYVRTLEADNERLTNEKRRPDDWQDALITRLKTRAEAAEVERDQLRDTLTRRTAAHDRLTQRLDQIRALADEWEREADETRESEGEEREGPSAAMVGIAHGRHKSATELRRVLDGDQRTEQP